MSWTDAIKLFLPRLSAGPRVRPPIPRQETSSSFAISGFLSQSDPLAFRPWAACRPTYPSTSTSSDTFEGNVYTHHCCHHQCSFWFICAFRLLSTWTDAAQICKNCMCGAILQYLQCSLHLIEAFIEYKFTSLKYTLPSVGFQRKLIAPLFTFYVGELWFSPVLFPGNS